MKPVQVTMLTPTHIAFEFKIKKGRLKELRAEGIFPEPDYLRPVCGGSIHVPYWKRETVAEFITSYGVAQ